VNIRRILSNVVVMKKDEKFQCSFLKTLE
jgi:hypothetical protein